MYFKKISMYGFKSFADPITIEFDRGITCVVGPNGSGKSNISDALRWVLGEQSPKMLRGGKMDEVIFAGTASRKSRGMAEVSLVIDNSDGELPIEFSEVAIMRRMYRSGESEYYINNSQCRLRDIRELIMDTGIGVDGYSLIGQGKISEIISGKPESRREIFEEAAGIVKYRSRKAETEKKLAATAANLERVNDIISDLKMRIGPLKKESERARRYLELSGKYRQAEICVILKNIESSQSSGEALRRQISDSDRSLEFLQKEKAGLEEEIRRLSARVEELDRMDLEERDRILRVSGEISEMRSRWKLLLEKAEALRQSAHDLEEEKAALQERLARESEETALLGARRAELEQSCREAESRLREKNDLFIRESRRLKEKESAAEEKRNRLYGLGAEISSKRAELAGLMNLRTSLKQRYEQLSVGLASEGADGELSRSYEEGLRSASALEAEKAELKNRLSEARSRLEKAERETAEASERLDLIRREIGKRTAKRDALKQLEHSYEGYNAAVRFVMRSKLPGIYGTVGELIRVPAGYETAVETALGARMQNIVCRDDASAKQAIGLLKKNRAGRLTFLPMESLRAGHNRPDASLSKEEGFLAAAADCVQTEERFRNALEYLLSGVAVVDTLDSAVRISKRHRGFRYVTLDGELVNPAGAITGGAYRKNENGGILDRKKRLSDMESALRELAEREERVRRELEAKKAGLEEQDRERRLLESSEKDAEIRLIGMRSQLSAAKSRLEDQRSREDRVHREVERIRREMAETDAAAERLNAEAEALSADSETLKADTERELFGIDSLRRSLESLGEEITGLRLKAETVRGEMNGAEGLISRAEASAAEFRESLRAKELSARQASGEADRLALQAEHIKTALDEAESSDTAGDGRLKEIREKKEDASRRLTEKNGAKEEAERSLFEMRSRRHEMSVHLENAESRMEALKDRLWDEFEISYLEARERYSADADFDALARESKSLRRQLKELGEVNTGSIAEYESVSERYSFLDGQRQDLTEAMTSLRRIIEDTDRRIRADFQSCFDAVNAHFEAIFSELFGGGKAQLSVSGPDPFEADIDIIVQPPGKKLQNMNLLSGGEKTMTAIALMFAVLRAKPTPFCILDEVEAALDEANIERFADYLKNFEGIQFVLVTHQKVTMEHANVLYGVTMPEKGISQVLSLRLADAEQLAE